MRQTNISFSDLPEPKSEAKREAKLINIFRKKSQLSVFNKSLRQLDQNKYNSTIISTKRVGIFSSD